MFFLPIADDNPVSGPTVANWILIAASIAVWLFQASMPPDAAERSIYAYGFIPAVFFGEVSLSPALAAPPSWATILTSMFMHGGLMHLAGNMLFLWIFGNNIEDAMGTARYVVFYLASGVAAAMAQALSDPSSTIPMVGASGAIAGVLGAYLILHPRANVRMLLVIVFFFRIISVPAVIVLGFWFVMQVAGGLSTPTEGGGVAFWAHVGGFVAGVALVPFFRRRGVVMFEPRKSEPFRVSGPRRGSVPSGGGTVWRRDRGDWTKRR